MKEQRSRLRTILVWATLFMLFILVFSYVKQSGDSKPVPFSQFLADVRDFGSDDDGGLSVPLSGVRTISVRGTAISGVDRDGRPFVSSGDLSSLGDKTVFLVRKGVSVEFVDPGQVQEDAVLSTETGEGVAVADAVVAPRIIPFSEFLRMALEVPSGSESADGMAFRLSKVAEVEVRGEQIEVVYRKGNEKKKTIGKLDDFEEELLFYGIQVNHEPADGEGFWVTFLVSWLPMLFLLLLFFYFIRQLQMGGGKAMSFGKSRHRLLQESARKVTFADIAGIDESKEELQEIVEFLRDPKRFTRLGGRIPKGVLLMGSPGTGKTLLARGVAGEAGVPFFSISGSDFVEMFVGVGASRVRDLFEQGKKAAPCIIFIDEIDAVGRHRGAGLGGGHDEREQTLNQLLVEMDGFESNEGVILIAATNRPDVLDPALLRPGRFDRRVVVPLPDVVGRTGILKVHTQNKPLAADVELEQVARGTAGFSGADLENLVNEAALLAARTGQDSIRPADLEEAKDKILLGAERRSMVLTEEEKRMTAFHEAGHTLVARLLPHADPLYKVTIVPRGMSLGATHMLPERDRHGFSKDWLLDTMAMLMAGRAAEELVFQAQTTGAGNDIQRATQWARKMVTEWGMSRLGPIAFDAHDNEVFLGRDFTRQPSYSEALGNRIDEEITRIVREAYERALQILTEHRGVLDDLAQTLIEKESMDRDEVECVLAKHGILPDQRGKGDADVEDSGNPVGAAGVGSDPVDGDSERHS
jgi:cell division protease FtsH